MIEILETIVLFAGPAIVVAAKCCCSVRRRVGMTMGAAAAAMTRPACHPGTAGTLSFSSPQAEAGH